MIKSTQSPPRSLVRNFKKNNPHLRAPKPQIKEICSCGSSSRLRTLQAPQNPQRRGNAAGTTNHVGSLALQAELNGSETGAGSAGLTWNGSARSLRRVITPLNPRSGEVDMWWCVVNGEAGKRRGRVYRHQQGGHRVKFGRIKIGTSPGRAVGHPPFRRCL